MSKIATPVNTMMETSAIWKYLSSPQRKQPIARTIRLRSGERPLGNKVHRRQHSSTAGCYLLVHLLHH